MTTYNNDSFIENLHYHKSEATLYGRFIKYTRFGAIMNTEFPRAPKEINIFIDMTQMMMPIFKFDNISDPLGLLATMINLPLHYRNFFNKAYIKSNIFLIYSTNDSVNNYRFIESYDYKHKMLIESHPAAAEAVYHNIEMMKTLCPYLPGIYLKIGTVEPTVIAYDLIDKFSKANNGIPNIFITSSEYAYQLSSVIPDTVVIFKKTRREEGNPNEDVSFSVNMDTVLGVYLSKAKASKISYNQYIDLPPWIGPLMTLTGLPCRDIKMLVNYSQALKILRYIKENHITIHPDSLYEAMQDVISNKMQIPREEMYKRYYAIDINYQLKLYREIPESLETSFLSDLNDMQGLYDIINLYFKEVNTIDLSKL